MSLHKNTLEKISATCVNQNVKKFSREITLIYDRKLTKNKITVNQFSVLSYIYYYEAIAIGKLAAKLSMDRTTLTKNLKPLFRQNYITTLESTDKRKKNLSLTKSGEVVLESSIALWKQAQQEIYKKYGKKEIHRLVSVLHAIKK